MCLARGVQPTYWKHNTHHMKPSHFIFTDHAVGLVLKRRKNKATSPASSDAAQTRSPLLSQEPWKQKAQMNQNGRKEVQHFIFPVNIRLCPACLSFYDISHIFPHPLGAPVEITGELSVCGKACLSYGGSQEGTGGFRGKKNWEDEEKQRFLLCSSAVLFVALFSLCVWR